MSCTMTAISLSRFPSMLRSLMLAEPKRRMSRHAEASHDGHHQYDLTPCFPAHETPILSTRERGRLGMWGPPEDEPEYELYRSRPAIVMLFSLSVMSLGDGTQHGSEPRNMKESSPGGFRGRRTLCHLSQPLNTDFRGFTLQSLCKHED